MAHYAWINLDNIVVNVTVGVDETVTQQGVGGSTEAWEQFYEQAINQEGVYVKRTSYNSTDGYRKQYAGIGYTYDAVGDVFVEPQPYLSWTLDSNHDWQPPTQKPDGMYDWNEEELKWIKI